MGCFGSEGLGVLIQRFGRDEPGRGAPQGAGMACRDLAAVDGLRQRAALQHVAREEPHRQGIPGAVGIHHGAIHENGRKVADAIPRAQGAAFCLTKGAR